MSHKQNDIYNEYIIESQPDWVDVKDHKMCQSCEDLSMIGNFSIIKRTHPLCFKRWWYENGFRHYGFEVISKQPSGVIAGGLA